MALIGNANLLIREIDSKRVGAALAVNIKDKTLSNTYRLIYLIFQDVYGSALAENVIHPVRDYTVRNDIVRIHFDFGYSFGYPKDKDYKEISFSNITLSLPKSEIIRYLKKAIDIAERIDGIQRSEDVLSYLKEAVLIVSNAGHFIHLVIPIIPIRDYSILFPLT